MTERLKKVLDWFYLGPNPYANQYFRQVVADGEAKPQADADAAQKAADDSSTKPKKRVAAAAAQ